MEDGVAHIDVQCSLGGNSNLLMLTILGVLWLLLVKLFVLRISSRSFVVLASQLGWFAVFFCYRSLFH